MPGTNRTEAACDDACRKEPETTVNDCKDQSLTREGLKPSGPDTIANLRKLQAKTLQDGGRVSRTSLGGMTPVAVQRLIGHKNIATKMQ